MLDVLYEDNHLLVVNKPPLLPTMGVAENKSSLVTVAKSYLKQKYNKPGNVFLGIVSRLDAFASGTIVLARTSKAASRLSQQIRSRAMDKSYLTIVSGMPIEHVGQLENWVAKDEPNHRMMTVSEATSRNQAKLAQLEYETLGQHENRSLLSVQLITGRKHQIRVQFSALRAPIVGDRKYGSREWFAAGIALHCHRLTFRHPTQKNEMSFVSWPPEHWNLESFGIKKP